MTAAFYCGLSVACLVVWQVPLGIFMVIFREEKGTQNPNFFRRPTMGPFFLSKNYRDFKASSLEILVFRGTFRPIWPNFDPVLTNSDLFWPVSPGRPDLSPIPTYSPGGPNLLSPISTYFSESGQGGWKTQGGGKHAVNSAKNPSPKTFLDPPTYDTFPPPFGDSLSFPLKERGTDETNPNFWGLQRWFWRAHSAVRFPPPQIHAIRFAPPSAAAQISFHKKAPWTGHLNFLVPDTSGGVGGLPREGVGGQKVRYVRRSPGKPQQCPK